jgi:hypothetical protein
MRLNEKSIGIVKKCLDKENYQYIMALIIIYSKLLH